MAAPRKYSDELRERATRLAVEARKDPAGRAGAVKRIAEQLDIHPEALRTWGKRAESDAGLREGSTSAETARIAELEREVKELRRANAILKSASATMFDAVVDAICVPRSGTGRPRRRPDRVLADKTSHADKRQAAAEVRSGAGCGKAAASS